MTYPVYLYFLNAISFSVISIQETMVFFVEHRAQPVLVEKVRTSAHAGVSCVPVCSTPTRQMFFGGWRHRAWPPLPFRSALLPSSLLWSFSKGFPCCQISGPFLCSWHDQRHCSLTDPSEIKLVKPFLFSSSFQFQP